MTYNIRAFLTEAYGTVASPLTLVVWVSAVVVAVVAGPFGTLATMTVAQRAVFWGATVSVSVLLGYTVRAIAMVLVGPHRPGLFDTVSVGLMTVVFAPFVWVLGHVVGPPPMPGLGMNFGYVFLVTLTVFLVRRLTPGIEERPYRFLRRATMPQPRLMRRLPAAARGRVLRLCAHDHLIDVITQNAVTPLRMRLRDAIEETEPVQGYRVHRSHWVARDAIARFEPEGSQKLFVVLVNGDRIRVSRACRAVLEEAGIIAPPGTDGQTCAPASQRHAAPGRTAAPPPARASDRPVRDRDSTSRR